MQKVIFLVMALLLSLSTNLFQHTYYGEKVDHLTQDKAELEQFYQGVIDKQSESVAQLEKQLNAERRLSLEKSEKLAVINNDLMKSSNTLNELGVNNEQIKSWSDSVVPDDVVSLLNSASGSGNGGGGYIPVPSSGTTAENTNPSTPGLTWSPGYQQRPN